MKKILVLFALFALATFTASRAHALASYYCVDDASDSGPVTITDCAPTCGGNDCSLREAITATNTSPALQGIHFGFSGDGPHVIQLASPLPAISAPLNIQGDTQPGYAGAPLVVVDGSLAGAGADGFDLTADNSQIIGLVICGFDGYGIRIESGSNDILSNYIGTDPTGTVGVPNGAGGIILNTLSAQNNNIGSLTDPTMGNVIAFNGGPGVAIEPNTDTDNLVAGNSIFANGGLGIDLNDDGVTLNDTDDADTGPDFLQNFPVLADAVSSGGTTTIHGSLNSDNSQPYRVEFFSNDACDASGNGEGQTFLGATDVTLTGTNADFTANLSADVASGKRITATAIDSKGDTSEFSACVTVTGPGVLAFGAATYAAGEGDGTAQVTIARTDGAIGAVSVDIATSDGTAKAGSDYTAVVQTVDFADGEAGPKTVSIPVTDDSSDESDETVNVTLSHPQGGAVLGSQTTAVVTIADNDSPGGATAGSTTGGSSTSGGCAMIRE